MRFVVAILLVLNLSCSSDSDKDKNKQAIPKTETSDLKEAVPGGDCGEVKHGESESRNRFEKAEVADIKDCKSEEQKRECKDGLLGEWSGTFKKDSCATRDLLSK